jgi:hypothetical protein
MASQTELWAGDLALSQDAESIKEAFAAAGHFIRSVRVHNKENRDVCGRRAWPNRPLWRKLFDLYRK